MAKSRKKSANQKTVKSAASSASGVTQPVKPAVTSLKEVKPAETAVKVQKPAVPAAVKSAEAPKATASKAAAPVKETVAVKAEAPAAKAPEVKKEEAPKAASTAAPVKKTRSTAKKPAARKTATKKAAAKPEKIQETFFQINGQDIKAEDIVAKVLEKYKSENHRIGSIKTLQTYVNVSEGRAYYVINGKAGDDQFIEY